MTVAQVLNRTTPYALLHTDMRDLMETIPPNSIDLIVADPPYDNSAHWMFFFLYEQARRVLVPGGHYIVITPQYLLDPFNSQLRSQIPEGWVAPGKGEFRLRWTIQMRQDEGPHPRMVNPDRILEVCGKVLSLYTKLPQPESDYRGLRDAFESIPIPKADRLHEWQQSEAWAEYCLQLGNPSGNGVVLDPLMGAGTTAVAALRVGLPYIGCDLDPEAVEITKQRVEREVL